MGPTAHRADAARRRRVDRDELLARVDLRALLDALTGAAGERGRWHCPDRDHPDAHPSVTVGVDSCRGAAVAVLVR